MLHSYWLSTTLKNKRKAYRIIKELHGFIGLYPNAFDNAYMLVAIFDTKECAEMAKQIVESAIDIGNGFDPGVLVSRVEDCKGL